ncbi:hypothetical protein BS78_05G290100 [Paspalum vaginatum]|nr:hypothetical protein BS78_05G290100 [Paspalum vaginatum]
MEDDGASSSCDRLNSIASLLYCHEDPLVPPATDDDDADSRSTGGRHRAVPLPSQPSSSSSVVVAGDEEEDLLISSELLLADHMARQRCYAPTRGYLEHLLSPLQQQLVGSPPIIPLVGGGGVSGARSRGVHYIIYAFGRLGLAAATVFNAVNYLDRFLSINCHLRWEAWMVELVSVACLSIACKLDEVNIPSLHDLQIEEVLRHSFLPATVRDMELTLLKALQWRLACVTPYSFLQLHLPLARTTAAAASRCTRLLIRSLAEPSLIRFDQSVIASSALRCAAAMDEHDPAAACYISRFLDRPGPGAESSPCPTEGIINDADECFRTMERLYDDAASSLDLQITHRHQLYCGSDEQQLWSPISVTPSQTGNAGRVSMQSAAAVSRCLFGGASASSSITPQGGSSSTTQLDDDDTPPYTIEMNTQIN